MDGLSHRDVLHAQADPLKEVNTVKKLIANRYSFFQIKRHITLKNEQLQVCFEKKGFLYKNLMLQILLTIAIPKS